MYTYNMYIYIYIHIIHTHTHVLTRRTTCPRSTCRRPPSGADASGNVRQFQMSLQFTCSKISVADASGNAHILCILQMSSHVAGCSLSVNDGYMWRGRPRHELARCVAVRHDMAQ